MFVISSCSAFSPQPTPTLTPIGSTVTLVPNSTPTVSSTPAPSVTPSPRPTKTATPQPEWITRFSQPILTAIASRQPDFQDDFDDKSGGWQREDWCGAARLKYQDGELVLTSCGARRAHIDYSDFVLKLDGRFLQGTNDDAWWGIFFRDSDGQRYSFSVYIDGSVWLGGLGGDPSFSPAALAGFETNHLMLIAKGSEFAFYVNDKPLYYIKDNKYRWGDIWFRAWGGGSPNITDKPSIVAFDNFMIWDIQDISIP
jgi:hypothetical protein